MINKEYSYCWLPSKNDKSWIKKVNYLKLFKYIYLSKNNKFIKEEIIFFINKKNINFVKNINKANLIFIINNIYKNEEYIIKYTNFKMYIFSKNNTGFLYALFHLFKLIKLNLIIKGKDFFIREIPSSLIRMIHHLDNVNGSIDKCYSGNSIFFLRNSVHYNLNRIKFYCKLLSSIKINYICINNSNVDLSSTYLITSKWLIQLYQLYNIFYKYNIKMFISINYKSPIIIGNLNTFDPLNKKVIKWWKNRIKKIYKYIPYLGGFVIETDNKYLDGPSYYKRNHAESSKLIANILKYFNGILFWKCSIYSEQNWKNNNKDIACDIYNYYNKLNGLFLNNVILLIKSGPIGYQVREPVSPLLGSMNLTSQVLELQINQEYTGQNIDICWLPMQWKYIFNFDTFIYNKKSTIKKLISGKLNNIKYYGINVISNIGDNYNWTGNYLSQLNLFSYGKISWNININLNNLINEWIKLSINNNNKVLINIKKIILNSWKNYELYTSPLGTGFMVNPKNKYESDIDGYEYNNYGGNYHYANRKNIGNNRTFYINQYKLYNKKKFNDINRCPVELILFFHKIPYNFFLKKFNKTLIQYIYDTHFKGVNNIKVWINLWNKLKFLINKKIFLHVKNKLIKQYINASNWCNKINTYFFRKSGINDIYKRKIY